MSQQELYNKRREQTEQILLDIRTLESQISSIQTTISNKRNHIATLKQRDSFQKQALDHITTLKKALIEQQQQDNRAPTVTSSNSSSSNSKHDLATLLNSPDAICKKIEFLIEKQQMTSLTEAELNALLQKIKQLYNHSFKDINSLMDTAYTMLLREKQFKQQQQQRQDEEDKYNKSNNAISLEEKMQELEEELVERTALVRELLEKKTSLEVETKQAEYRLAKRIHELHSDSEVQTALARNLRRKATGHQIYVELMALEKEADALFSQYERSKEEKEKRENNGISYPTSQQDIQSALGTLREEQKKALELMVTNQNYVKHLNQQHKDGNAYLSEEIQSLLDRLETAKNQLVIQRNSGKPRKEHGSIHLKEEGKKEMDLLIELKNKLSPFTNISITRTISEIEILVEKLKELEKLSPTPNIFNLLNGLVSKWVQEDYAFTEHKDLNDIKVFIDRVRDELESRKKDYVSIQEEWLKNKLVHAESIQREVDRTRQSLNSRQLLYDVGSDYTIQDLTFEQWVSKG